MGQKLRVKTLKVAEVMWTPLCWVPQPSLVMESLGPEETRGTSVSGLYLGSRWSYEGNPSLLAATPSWSSLPAGPSLPHVHPESCAPKATAPQA